jgi:ABC-2 type transport system permease protein
VTTEISVSAPSVGRLIWEQFRFQNKIVWRTPISVFFTLVFPLMLLLLFTAIFGNNEIEGLGVTTAQFFTPGLAAFAAVSATYTGLAIGMAIARDNGILKRVRGAPIPPWAYMTGRVASSIWLALLATLIMMTVGVAFYSVHLYARTLPAVIVTFFVGTLCFSALGMLVAAISPNGDATPAITNATLLPIAFVSDIFIPLDQAPGWLTTVGDIFPLKAFAVAFRDGFDPTLVGAQWHWKELGIMVAWGLIGGILALRLFKWEPSQSAGRRSRRSAAKADAAG